ncbi:MAG: F0F1 ATP synthase subunit gamma [Cyanobacteria bacterium J06621_11]
MPTQSTLHRQLQSAQELQSIVRTMKALAVGNIHQYENAVRSLATFNHTLKQGLQIFLRHYPEVLQPARSLPKGRLGVVVFGSDQGMCGRFNEQIADYVIRHLSHHTGHSTGDPINHGSPSAEDIQLLVVGSRIGERLTQAGYPPNRCLAVPSALGKVSERVQTIVMQLEDWRRAQQVERIWVFHNAPHQGLSSPKLRQIYPLDHGFLQRLAEQPWSSRCRPVVFHKKVLLFSSLFRQFFFVRLYRACVDSLASENAHRLASMQMAEKNVNERLENLHRLYQQQRQTAVTSELLDIVSGFEVLKGEGG